MKILNGVMVRCDACDNYNSPEFWSDPVWKDVHKIGVRAFGYTEGELEVALIPESVEEIGVGAFAYCRELQKLSLPEGLRIIAPDAFSSTKITELTFPKSLVYLGEHAFAFSKLLTKVTIPGSVKELQEGVFACCSELKEVILEKGIKTIGEMAFDDCRALTSVSLPDGLTSIGRNAFMKNIALKAIKIPETVEKIDDYAFTMSGLTEIEIPDTTTELGEGVFANCSKLRSVKLPKNLTEIPDQSFSDCVSMLEINLPETVHTIGLRAFVNCNNLRKINFPEGLKVIKEQAFDSCRHLHDLILPSTIERIDSFAFSDVAVDKVSIPMSIQELRASSFNFNSFEYVCISKDFKTMTFYSDLYKESNPGDIIIKSDGGENPEYKALYSSGNYRQNFINLYTKKQQGKIKFMPAIPVLKTFPPEYIENFFVNNNHVRWGRLVKTLGFDKLENQEKENSIQDLMKIYYAIGGFSTNQGESEKAYNYILEYVAKPILGASFNGAEVHRRFSKFVLGEYNPVFAQFFMKYYKDNPDFMCLSEHRWSRDVDYLAPAHNNFARIQKYFPNRTVNGNEERALLSPKFVADHCEFVSYYGVEDGNEMLADLVGRYSYTQSQFEDIQIIYDKAKKLKDSYVIRADKAFEGKNAINFRVLEKDDPLGFVLGDITNCCQHIGGAGASCVDDGYTNKNAGFLVFEETVKDKDGNELDEKRVLGQAYVWYDPETATVCYDNIEIPTKVLDELRRGDKHDWDLSASKFLDAVERSAENIMMTMNAHGTKVTRVTTGEGYNDLKSELERRYYKEKRPIAAHRKYHGYTDASQAQYVIATYDEVTRKYSDLTRNNLALAQEALESLEQTSAETMER